MIDTPIDRAKILWIPTAAIDENSITYVEKFRNDLLQIGIKDSNIITYNLDREMTVEEILSYNVVFICSGNCQYLLDKIHAFEFDLLLKKYVSHNGVYVGVSAGSCIASYDFTNSLKFLKCRLDVHCNTGDNVW